MNTINFDNFKLIKKQTCQDNSKFLHAFVQGFDRGYIKSTPKVKSEIVTKLRESLSEKLAEKIPNSNVTYYEYIFNGKIKNVARSNSLYEYKNYMTTLKGDYLFTNEYIELISLIFDKDIFLFDIDNNELFIDPNIAKLVIKERNSVLIGYSETEYFTLGLLEEDKNIITHFSPNNKFIKMLRSKMAL